MVMPKPGESAWLPASFGGLVQAVELYALFVILWLVFWLTDATPTLLHMRQLNNAASSTL